jgi:hypothetical protein
MRLNSSEYVPGEEALTVIWRHHNSALARELFSNDPVVAKGDMLGSIALPVFFTASAAPCSLAAHVF